MNHEVIIEDLSISEFRQYMQYSFKEKKHKTQKEIIREQVEEGNEQSLKKQKINDSNVYFISNIRQYVSFYRGMDDERHDVQPSIKRLYGSSKYYNLLKESLYISGFFNSPFINERNEDKISINLMARMQHYNYKSRLIDITFNYAVAVYMASCSEYLLNGKVIEFNHKSNKKRSRFANPLERYHYISSPSRNLGTNLKYMNYLISKNPIPKFSSSYESNPVVIIDRQTFKHNTAAYDLRYDAQEGAFIMFLNKSSHPSRFTMNELDCDDLTSSKLSYKRIRFENKMAFLFVLADAGVTNVTIYPDKDTSHEVSKIIAKVDLIRDKKNKLSSLDASIEQYLRDHHFNQILSTSDISHLKGMAKHYIKQNSKIEFILTDYLSMLIEKNQLIKNAMSSKFADFNKAVDVLVSTSSNIDFYYLKI